MVQVDSPRTRRAPSGCILVVLFVEPRRCFKEWSEVFGQSPWTVPLCLRELEVLVHDRICQGGSVRTRGDKAVSDLLGPGESGLRETDLVGFSGQ